MINSLVMDASNTLAPDGRDILVEIKSVEVELEGANILGQVKAGSICLEGKLFQMRFHKEGILIPVRFGLNVSWMLSSFTT
jgi:hypothetical protein